MISLFFSQTMIYRFWRLVAFRYLCVCAFFSFEAIRKGTQMVPNVYVDIFSSLFDVCFFFAYHAITSTPPDHSFHHEVYLTAKSRAWPSLWEDKNNIREREVCRLMQRNIFFCCLSLAFSLSFLTIVSEMTLLQIE